MSPEPSTGPTGPTGRLRGHWRRLPPALTGLPLALVLGAAGGWLFVQLDFPLPWLIGAVFLTILGAFAGLPMAVPMSLRNGMVLVLGLLVGSGFTPALLDQVHRWTVSIAMVLLYAVCAALLIPLVLRLVGRMRWLDAFFSGLPGGLAAVVFVGEEVGADIRTLSLIHSTRVVLVCFAVPLWYRLVEGVTAAGAGRAALGGFTLWDLAVFAVSGIVGYGLARRLRIPAPYLLGPLLLSAAAHLSGLTDARPPGLVVNAAQVVVGAAIGCRFVGVRWQRIVAISGQGLVSTGILLALALLFAAAASRLSGIPFDVLLLAFAPGGLPEMTLVALALDVDVALVVSHHLARVLFINIGVPMLFRAFMRRLASRDAAS